MSKKTYKDEAGNVVPGSKLSKYEKRADMYAKRLAKKALRLHQQLGKTKQQMLKYSDSVLHTKAKERNIDLSERKGNFTWYSFDKSVKVEVNIQEGISFDDLLLKSCRDKLMSFLDEKIKTEEDFIKQLVSDAFQTRTGKLDTQRVLGLLRYRSKIQNKKFQSAMIDLEDSIRRNVSKTYTRIWLRNTQGEYENIDLNFSSIEAEA